MLSVIVPAYNEAATLGSVIQRVLRLPVSELEILVVDDGSLDQTAAVARAWGAVDSRVRFLSHPTNRGKGAAIRTALAEVAGEIVVVQDADLENDPADLIRMLRLFEIDSVSVVYGSRWLHRQGRSFTASRLAALALSWVVRGLYRCQVTDVPTCYKMFRTGVLRSLALAADRFDFCPEVTAKALLSGFEIHEVPISYCPRSRMEGKKIRWRDGWSALWALIRWRLPLTGGSWLQVPPVRGSRGVARIKTTGVSV